MKRMLLRACPRCGGDMIATDDAFSRLGPYWSCLQCGCTVESKPKEAVAA